MRIERAIDAYLDWRRLERDATPRSVDSYRRILEKLADDNPELDLASFTKHNLRAFLRWWELRSASTRANVVSVLHSFFGWACAEDLVEVDPSAALRRPKKRARTSTGRASTSSRRSGRLHSRTSCRRFS